MRSRAFFGLIALPVFLLAQARPPFEYVGESSELGFLQQVAASAAYAQQFVSSGPIGKQAKDLRVAAYCRLGRIGTLDALDSMGRIEDGIMKIYRQRTAFWPQYETNPLWHVKDEPLAPLVTLETREGVFGIFASTALGRHDFYLAATRAPLQVSAAWTRPLLLPIAGHARALEPELRRRGEDLLFSYSAPDDSPSGRVEHVIKLSEVERDRDSDGWTDIEEARLALNPARRDSDGDRIADGEDTAPSYRFAPLEYKRPEVNLLQKAMIATFGLSGSRHLLVVGPGSQPLQAVGYAGPVLFAPSREEWLARWPQATFIEWKISDISEVNAVVEIADQSAARREGLQRVIFRRINNEWIVIDRQTEWRAHN